MYKVNVKDRNYLTNQMIFYSWLENIKSYDMNLKSLRFDGQFKYLLYLKLIF
jgi:hypothetical protein